MQGVVKTKIVAKYRSRCRVCGGAIEPGEQIEWERGKGSAHLECTKRENAKDTTSER
jgi:hypothetical protein